MEFIKDGKVIIQSFNVDKTDWDMSIKFELALVLYNRTDLLGIMLSLFFLNQIGFIHFKTFKHLSEAIGLSDTTLRKKLKELQALGLLEILINSNKIVMNIKNLCRHKNFMLPTNPSKQSDYLESTVKSILENTQKDGQLPLTHSIYTNNTSKSNNLLTNKDISNMVPNDNRRFPKEDYNLVLDAFKKYKGVGLFGPEIPQCLRAIKTMFRADRKTKEIIEFMKWLHDNENNEDVMWVRTWTIWTVQKKIPEFVAGKLKVRKMEDDYEF